MTRIGVTGTLGAGKSTLARLFESWGAWRIDADQLARDAVAPGTPALERIQAEWGDGVVASGALDRLALRRIVFADPEARKRLEAIVHPEVRRLREIRLAEASQAGAAVVVEEVPLLFEVGMAAAFDAIVVVDAARATRRLRVLEERSLASAEFDAMEAAQIPAEAKRRGATWVIDNDGTPQEFETAARALWEQIAAGTQDRSPGAGAAEAPEGWTVDLHMHTCFSQDCLSDPAEVIRAAQRAGLDRIAVTDHNEIEGAFAAREIAPDLVIVGEEVRTAEGLDLIGLFLTERIEKGTPFAETANRVHAQGGVVYLPHPFDKYRGGKEEFFDGHVGLIDMVEGFNARVHDARRNERAVRWAERHGLPLGAGSDAHLLSEIGRGRLALAPFDGPEEFMRSAATGTISGTASRHWVHFGSTWAKVSRKFPFGRMAKR
jgi:dephospho-CoA kinase